MSGLLIALGVVLVATAFACTPQAVIDTDQPVPPGGVATGEGSGFGPSSVPGETPVQLSLSTRAGEQLGIVWSGASNAAGRFSFAFDAPQEAGHYVISARRPGTSGRPIASNNLQVGNPAAEQPAPAPAPADPPQPVAAPAPNGSPAPAPGDPSRPPVAVPAPGGSPAPALGVGRGEAPASGQRRASAPSGGDRPARAGAPQPSPGAPVLQGLGAVTDAPARSAVQERGESTAAPAAGAPSDRRPAASREASVAAPQDGQRSIAAGGGASGASSGGSVWLGLALIGTGLLAALTAGAAMLGGGASHRWSPAVLRRRR